MTTHQLRSQKRKPRGGTVFARVAVDKNSGRSVSGDSSSPRGNGGVAHVEPLLDHRTPVVDGAFHDSGLTTRTFIEAIFTERRFPTFFRVPTGNSHDEDDVVIAHELVRRRIQPIAEDVIAGAVFLIRPVVREDLHDGGRLDDPGFVKVSGEPGPARIFNTPVLATG